MADKITSILAFNDKLQMHLSRGVRWDSDHVTVTADELSEVMREIKGRTLLTACFWLLISSTAALTGSRAHHWSARGA